MVTPQSLARTERFVNCAERPARMSRNRRNVDRSRTLRICRTSVPERSGQDSRTRFPHRHSGRKSEDRVLTRENPGGKRGNIRSRKVDRRIPLGAGQRSTRWPFHRSGQCRRSLWKAMLPFHVASILIRCRLDSGGDSHEETYIPTMSSSCWLHDIGAET